MEEIRENEELGKVQGYYPVKSAKYVLVSKAAYLLGVYEEYFSDEGTLKKDIYKQLDLNKNCRIVRNLAVIRTSLERAYKRINDALSMGRQDVFLIEDVPQWAVMGLARDSITLPRASNVTDAMIYVNTLLSDRLNNCRNVFPDWINWEYIRDLFLMPNGTTFEGIRDAAMIYYERMRTYPFQIYLNAPEMNGYYFFANDRQFITALYEWNADEFPPALLSAVQDLSETYKGNIYSFIDSASKVIMIVDCENSDPFNVISMLRGLNEEELEKVSKIILINDVHASLGWNELRKYTSILVEELMTTRVLAGKSLVDGVLIGKCFEEYYERGVDSICLLSSDSDYWALISMLKKAKFLVMVEHSKTSSDLKEKLLSEGIFYCYLDDFYSGEEADQMKKEILLRNLAAEIHDRDFNIKEIFDNLLTDMRYTYMSDAEKKRFYSEHLKNIKITVTENGTVEHNIK